MTYKYFSRDGQVLPAQQATVPLNNIEYSYGFGVYETIRLSKGQLYFLDEHCQRLLNSAKIINLDHKFPVDFVQDAVLALIKQNQAETCNIKILLIGGLQPNLYILCLNPHFPDRKLYKTGVSCITYQYERGFPAAKTLNMLPSYLAYRQAKTAGAHEALLINRKGNITEGTRSNFFAIKDGTIISPPETDILPGVTRHHVLQVIKAAGLEMVERDIKPDEIHQCEGAFLTSTSAKVMPINQIGNVNLDIPASLRELTRLFDQYLAESTKSTYN